MERVAIYTRVSGQTQVKGESLSEQAADGRAWAKRHGHKVVAIFTDGGKSGTLPADQRPGLIHALELMAECGADILAVRDLDRLARALTVQEATLAQIWACPTASVVEFAYDKEVLRDDPDDPMRTAMRQMAGVFKQLDRAMTVKKLRDARRHKSARGQHAQGIAPYGWRTHTGHLYPVPEEQEVIALALSLRADGLNQTQIARRLNEAGFKTRGSNRKPSGRWTQPQVSRLLTREDRLSDAEREYRESRRAAA